MYGWGQIPHLEVLGTYSGFTPSVLQDHSGFTPSGAWGTLRSAQYGTPSWSHAYAPFMSSLWPLKNGVVMTPEGYERMCAWGRGLGRVECQEPREVSCACSFVVAVKILCSPAWLPLHLFYQSLCFDLFAYCILFLPPLSG